MRGFLLALCSLYFVSAVSGQANKTLCTNSTAANCTLVPIANVNTNPLYIQTTESNPLNISIADNKQPLLVTISQAFSPKYPWKANIADYNESTHDRSVPVVVQIQFIKIKKITSVEQEFTADFYMTAWWPDRTVCPDVLPADLADCQFDSNNNWGPNFDFANVNGQMDEFVANPYSVGTRPQIIERVVWPERNGKLDVNRTFFGDVWVKFDQRYTGSFTTKLLMPDFPFDRQTVNIIVESSLYTEKEVKFYYANDLPRRVLPSDIDPIPEWEIDGNISFCSKPGNPKCPITVEQCGHYYPIFKDSYSRFKITLHVKREAGYYMTKIVYGVMLLVTMNFLVYSLAVDSTDRQMGTLSIFLALVTYLFVASDSVPRVSESTRIDYFMAISFAAVFFTMFVHAILYVLREDGGAITENKAAEVGLGRRRSTLMLREISAKLGLSSPQSDTITLNDSASSSSSSSSFAPSFHKSSAPHAVKPKLTRGLSTAMKEAFQQQSKSISEAPKVEDRVLGRLRPWRHMLFTRRADLIVVVAGYAVYLIAVAAVLFRPFGDPGFKRECPID